MQINVCDWPGESGHLQFYEVLVTLSALGLATKLFGASAEDCLLLP
jgi:hypothetical protein